MIKRIILYTFIAISAVVILLPFAWMISISFKMPNGVYKFPPNLIPSPITLSNYPGVFKMIPFLRSFGNTVYMLLAIGVVSSLTSAMAGYAFAKYKFRGRNLLFTSMIATIMVPAFVIIIPMYVTMTTLNWDNSFKVLIIPFLANPMGIFMMRQFILSFPDELMWAARLDGCSESGIFFRVVWPSLMPAMASLVILTVSGKWDDLVWPSIMINKTELWVMAVALNQFARIQGQTMNITFVMAASFMSIAPIMTLFLLMQRFFISSITMEGFKE